jgi:hypothetical protein
MAMPIRGTCSPVRPSEVLPTVGAGLCATGAMSAVVGLADKLGIMDEEPPRIIVASVLPVRPKSTLTNFLAVAAHLGYGTAAGLVFAALPERVPRSARAGVVYGALLYGVGYEGWLPILGVLPPAHRDRRPRVATMLVSHLVYGATLAYASRTLAARDRASRDYRASSRGELAWTSSSRGRRR